MRCYRSECSRRDGEPGPSHPDTARVLSHELTSKSRFAPLFETIGQCCWNRSRAQADPAALVIDRSSSRSDCWEPAPHASDFSMALLTHHWTSESAGRHGYDKQLTGDAFS